MTRLFRLLSHLPLAFLHGIGWILGWLVFLASATYRRRFLANVQLGMRGELADPHGSGRRTWRRAVGAAGELVAELPRLWFGTPVPVHWVGEALLEAALTHGRGVIFLTPHLGSFEVTAQAYAARYGQGRQPITVLFRPPRQAWLKGLVNSARARPGLHTAPTTLAGVKQMLKALKAGQAIGLLPDQVPPEGMGVWAPFFGRQAYTMTLVARLVKQTGAQVVLAWGERLAWGRGYRVHLSQLREPLAAETEAAAGQINRAMETLIRECPQQYLWGYARYKAPGLAVVDSQSPGQAPKTSPSTSTSTTQEHSL